MPGVAIFFFFGAKAFPKKSHLSYNEGKEEKRWKYE